MFHLSLNFLFLANEIIAIVADVLNLKSKAYQEVPKYFRDRGVDSVDYVDPIPPNCFKLGHWQLLMKRKRLSLSKLRRIYLLEILRMELLLMLKLQVLRDLYGFELPGTTLFYFPNWFNLVQ